jgi:hypothetical protein
MLLRLLCQRLVACSSCGSWWENNGRRDRVLEKGLRGHIYITWWGGSGSLVIVVVAIWSHSIFWAVALFHSGEQDMVRLVRFQSYDQRRRPEAQQIDVVPACYVVDEVDGVYLEKLRAGHAKIS